MKYVCKICGYVYDENKEGVPFAKLPDSWTCPLCGAAKSDFEAQDTSEVKASKQKTTLNVDHEMQKLSVGELSAVCSNLARGCEKQYKQEESELFTVLAKYFASVVPADENARTAEISKLIQSDIDSGYPDINLTAGKSNDRGALRVSAWGEKVTRILNTLLNKYEQEGESFLADTEIWVCSVCGFIYTGDNPPELCPVCKVPSWKFEKVERRNV